MEQGPPEGGSCGMIAALWRPYEERFSLEWLVWS
jgi:hypothetical protein